MLSANKQLPIRARCSISLELSMNDPNLPESSLHMLQLCCVVKHVRLETMHSLFCMTS